MRILSGSRQRDMAPDEFMAKLALFPKVHVDVGTGSGRYVLRHARKDKDTLFIGMDPVADAMITSALRADKLGRREGVNNLLFVISAIETFPAELNAVGSSISVNLPWGLLRDGIVTADSQILGKLRLLGKTGCSFAIIIGYDDEREASEIERRHLPQLSVDYFLSLHQEFALNGIRIDTVDVLGNSELRILESDWARKLAYGVQRRFYKLSGEYV